MSKQRRNGGLPFEIDDLVYCENLISDEDCFSDEPIHVSDKLLHALLGNAYRGGPEALRAKIQKTKTWARLAKGEHGYQPAIPPGTGPLIAKHFESRHAPTSYVAGIAQGMRRHRLCLLVALFHKINGRLPTEAEVSGLDNSH